MINLPNNVLDMLDRGEIGIIGLLLLQLGSGSYGFAKSQEPVLYNGVTYQPGGIIEVSELSASTGLFAQEFTLTLSASPDDGLTPAVLQTIEAEDYR